MALILLVDDDPDFRALAVKRLGGAGLTVVEAATGLRGLDLATSGHPDLILLDINLPELDGFAVLRKIKANPMTERLPVICITGNRDRDSILKAVRLGAADYIAKPIKYDFLIEKIELLLKQHQGNELRRDSIEIVRQSALTRIVFYNTLSQVLAAVPKTLTESLIGRIRLDPVVIDLSAMIKLDPADVPILSRIVGSLAKIESLSVLAGRHLGAIVADGSIPEEVPAFMTTSELEEYLGSRKKAGP